METKPAAGNVPGRLGIQPATRWDLPGIEAIYSVARDRMAQNGNPRQWTDGYPRAALLAEDIEKGELYKVTDGETLVGVFALVAGPDEVYERIDGAWLNDAPYLVIHRIASKGGRGVARAVFDWVLERTESLRIDTHADNRAMRHILEHTGFVYVGELTLPDGAPRRAYHRLKRP